MQDAAQLTASDDLFARKFDAEVDACVLDILESHLRAQDVANPPEASGRIKTHAAPKLAEAG